MATQTGARKRNRGEIETLPSGSLRVKVYAGIDPVSKKRHYLTEVIPPGPKAQKLAERARTRLVNQVDERRHPRTNATVNQLMERHLDLLDAGPTWVAACRGYHRLHIAPLIGTVKAGALGADVLDSFFAELRRCRAHCDRRPYIDHRTTREHQCDDRCRQHRCQPLGRATIRQIHFLLHGAYKRGVRWKWVSVNPIDEVEPPDSPAPNPRPTTVEETARIISAAWESDPAWGAFLWLDVALGDRRGEQCALRWGRVDRSRHVLTLDQAVAKDDHGQWYIKDTKTHQHRRVTYDAPTAAVLDGLWARYTEQCAALDMSPSLDAFVFSRAPDHSTFLIPDSVSQRFGRLVARLGIDTKLHALRHYSATELIAAGVDVRTVAGRLGHGGGGVTTLRIYSAFLEEADQRAAGVLAPRMPPLPAAPMSAVERAKTSPRSPYERIAAQFREQILDGQLPEGSLLPPIPEIAETNEVSVGTAHRAVALLNTWCLVDVVPGQRTVVTRSELRTA